MHLGGARALKNEGKTLEYVLYFLLHLFSVCFTADQNTVEASLFNFKYQPHLQDPFNSRYTKNFIIQEGDKNIDKNWHMPKLYRVENGQRNETGSARNKDIPFSLTPSLLLPKFSAHPRRAPSLACFLARLLDLHLEKRKETAATQASMPFEARKTKFVAFSLNHES